MLKTREREVKYDYYDSEIGKNLALTELSWSREAYFRTRTFHWTWRRRRTLSRLAVTQLNETEQSIKN